MIYLFYSPPPSLSFFLLLVASRFGGPFSERLPPVKVVFTGSYQDEQTVGGEVLVRRDGGEHREDQAAEHQDESKTKEKTGTGSQDKTSERKANLPGGPGETTVGAGSGAAAVARGKHVEPVNA